MKKLETSRRGFLRGFAGGAIATASNRAAMAVKASGLPVPGMKGIKTDFGSGLSVDATANKSRKNFLTFMKTLKIIPDFKKEELRSEAKYIRDIEPHIASMVYVSLSAKVNMQRRLNYKEFERRFWEEYRPSKFRKIREEFMKKHDIDWI